MAGHPIVVYDGDCPLCSRSIEFIVRHESAASLRFAAQASPAGRRLLQQAGLACQAGSSVILLESGRAFLHSTASLRIMRHMRRPWRWLAWLLVIPRPIRDGLYRLIARRRHRICRPGSVKPTGIDRRRIIE